VPSQIQLRKPHIPTLRWQPWLTTELDGSNLKGRFRSLPTGLRAVKLAAIVPFFRLKIDD